MWSKQLRSQPHREKSKRCVIDISWILCPLCGKKTRVQVREDTVMYHFPLFCPKCKKLFLIDVKNQEIESYEELDA